MSKPSTPSVAEELLRDAADRGIRYLSEIQERSVAPTPEALAQLARLHEPLPEESSDPREVLRLLDEVGSPATIASAGPRFFGFVIGGSLPGALAASWLAAAWDQNAGLEATSPVAAALERASGRWIREIFGFPAGSGVGFVTGATMANFAGLAAARHVLLSRSGWDVEARGLFGAPELRVVVGDEVHTSPLKALALLGLGRDRVIRVPVDDQGRMRADRLPDLGPRTILCLQAGNVNTGSFDPAEDIIPRAKAAGSWVHVDGAFGLWASVAPSHAHLTAGYEDADSWATDAHKWLNVPYDSGLVIVRDGADLRAAMSASAAYLVKSDTRDPSDYAPELSRRARGVEVWAALRSLGRRGLADLIETSCLLAQGLADGLRQAGFEVLNDVVLNQALVDFGESERTTKVIAALQSGGTAWAGGTLWQGRTAMRLSLSSWATTAEDCDRTLKAILQAAEKAG